MERSMVQGQLHQLVRSFALHHVKASETKAAIAAIITAQTNSKRRAREEDVSTVLSRIVGHQRKMKNMGYVPAKPTKANPRALIDYANGLEEATRLAVGCPSTCSGP